MQKILLTGDVHLGRSYQKAEPEVAERLQNARIQALRNAVNVGNREKCSTLVVAGDLFDKVYAIPVSLIKEASRALGEFDGDVLIIPGNHDYCGENDSLWHTFQEYSASNTYVFMKNEARELGNITFYACICHGKYSETNALGWLKEESLNGSGYHIGIAHGAIEGLSLDKEGKYYYMSRNELLNSGMDAWLIGHTHIAYPSEPTGTGVIFNAGTPQQTDIADNSVGEVFVLTLEENQPVKYEHFKTGTVQFAQRKVQLNRENLREVLCFPELDAENTVLRVTLCGTATQYDYETRNSIYTELSDRYLFAEINDSELKPEITVEMIDRETMNGTKINLLLHGYENDPELLNLAYELAMDCKER